MTEGIYTLANDVVYDQLVALLNSFEVNVGNKVPVCVIPYDNQLDKVRAEIKRRKNVTLFDDVESISRWENFSRQAWSSNSEAWKVWREQGCVDPIAFSMNRKFCCWDGPFEKFIYTDGDTLLIGPLNKIYERLNDCDWVANDFQYKSDIRYIFNNAKQLNNMYSDEYLKSKVFCAGFMGSKKSILNGTPLSDILTDLLNGEANSLAFQGPGGISLRYSDQQLFNYIALKKGCSFYNFAYHDAQNTPGNHHSSKFEEKDHILYDKGRRITYLHYMGIPASVFTRACQGENIDFPYRDVFLHYRYLHEPEKRPVFRGKSKAWYRKPSFLERVLKKIRFV